MEENKTVFFQGEVTYTKENLKEYLRNSIFLDRRIVTAHAIYCILMLVLLLSPVGPSTHFYLTLFIAAIIILRRIQLSGNNIYDRIISQNEGVPLHQTYEFNDYHIFIFQPRNQNQHKLHYAQITGIAQTKRFYVLFMQHRQYVLLEKDTLTGGTEDDFVRFLCGACPRLKPKKLCNSTFGKIAYYTLIALLGIAAIIFALRYFFWFWFV